MKVKRIRKLTLWDRLYLPSILAGLWVTFRHVFRKKDTLQYPEQSLTEVPEAVGLARELAAGIEATIPACTWRSRAYRC